MYHGHASMSVPLLALGIDVLDLVKRISPSNQPEFLVFSEMDLMSEEEMRLRGNALGLDAEIFETLLDDFRLSIQLQPPVWIQFGVGHIVFGPLDRIFGTLGVLAVPNIVWLDVYHHFDEFNKVKEMKRITKKFYRNR
jgi:hypothetical protein